VVLLEVTLVVLLGNTRGVARGNTRVLLGVTLVVLLGITSGVAR